MFDDLSIPIKLHCYQSGVKVLLLTGHQGDAIRSKVIDFIMQKSESNDTRYVGISRTNLATHLGMSVAVAGYYLEDAEAQGILCRDDSPIGLFFYKNLFPVF
jgi:ESCRT-II complex subunit VPS36